MLKLKPGAIVKIKGLNGAAKYNGKQGLVLEEIEDRWTMVSALSFLGHRRLRWCSLLSCCSLVLLLVLAGAAAGAAGAAAAAAALGAVASAAASYRTDSWSFSQHNRAHSF
jgi:hypothetical protein